MTAEVAIMNKSAVALAADSAGTIRIGDEQKIFEDINKLFALSKFHPVGLMVYGSAEFMGVDWETIVKLFRNCIQERSFNTLHDYVDHFLRFLEENNNELFDQSSQETFIEGRIRNVFFSIREEVINLTQRDIVDNPQITTEHIQEHLRTIVTKRHSDFRGYENIKSISGTIFSDTQEKVLRELLMPSIVKSKEMVFENLPLSSSISRRLTEIALYSFTKEAVFSDTSGIVIAGYGSNDIFPALEELLIDGIFNNTLKFHRQRVVQIDRKNTATIIPFAQSEMVAVFMEGVEPKYRAFLSRLLPEILKTYNTELLDLFSTEYPEIKGKYKQEISQIRHDLMERFSKRAEHYRNMEFIQPVINIVEHLPKSELAAMAESLVNLTSFRRHVTPAAETVGGPIDVAVISHGDGFIWIKRKHYFQPEFNPHFLTNYYRRTIDGPVKENQTE